MRVIVCGSRNETDRRGIFDELETFHFYYPITTLIHGGAKGVDSFAGEWAEDRGIPVEVYPADWNKHGRAAGPIRNQKMIEQNPRCFIAFDGGPGTANMVKTAKIAGVKVVHLDKPEPHGMGEWE
jgi:hypothetical protein